MVEFIIGQAGSGKTTLMFERIKNNTDKACIIVPEQFSYEFDKTLYFYLGAGKFNEQTSLSFTGLSRELFQLFGEPDRKGEYANEYARMIMIYQAINSVRNQPESLNFFRRQSLQSGFAEEVLDIINDMKRSGIEPQQLLNKAAMMDKRLMDKTTDISMIYLEYEQLMKKYGFKNILDNIKEAAVIADQNNYFDGKSVFIDEFESFTGDQIKMLRVMISSAKNVTINLRTDDVDAGEFTLFETVNSTYRKIADICREYKKEYKITKCSKSYRFKHSDLEYLSGHIMRNFRYSPQEAPEVENIRIFEAKDMYSEAEYVCASIKRLIHSDKSLKYRDFAVVSNDIANYSDVLKAAFSRYEIPYFLSIERAVTHTAVMVFFTSLLNILSAKKFRSEQIFRIMKSGLLDISLTDVSLLENYCYKWSIDGDIWRETFTADDKDLDRIETIRSSFIEPIITLKKKLNKKDITAEKICLILYDYLVNCGAERNTGRLMSGLIKENRDFEASEVKRMWGCLIDILDSVAGTLKENVISFNELAKIIKSMIGKINYSVPPQTLDSVIAASARTARLNSPKVVFAIGSTDGDFPNQISMHGLFSESDKMVLAKNGIEISRPLADLIASERLVVYKTLSSASDKLYITYPLSDLSGQAKYPAPAVDQIIKMFGDKEMLITQDDVPPHYYAVTIHSAYYHYMQNRGLNNSEIASIKKVLLQNQEYSRRIVQVLSRYGYKQNYKIDEDIMKKLKSFAPLKLSATALNEYNLCHFKYFCEKCLKLQTCEKVELDARASGEFAHLCFSEILASRTKEKFIELSYNELQNEISSCAEKYRKEKMAGDFGKKPKFELIYNKTAERLTNVFLHTQQSLMNSSFTPHAFELDMRDKNAVVLDFGKKYKLTFGGIVDRVDICEVNGQNYICIVDYKSSQKKITPVTLGSGIDLQMLLYLFAATDKGGVYENYEPAGVLYSPIQISAVESDDYKIDSLNSSVLNSELKTSGLVISDKTVLEAMENCIGGKYIPVKLLKSGEFDRYSTCISKGSIKKLRDFTYSKLIKMAESLLSGDAEAEPLVKKKENPCEYCGYVNICDNSRLERFKTPDAESVAEAEEILSRKIDVSEGEEE